MGEKLDAAVSAPIPWLCKREMQGFALLGFALFQLFRDLFKGTSSLASCSGRIRSKLDTLY